jgi:sulfatase modifying factor 1
MTLGEAGALQATPPQMGIAVSAFEIDAYEVTVARFRRFWNAGHPSPRGAIVYPGGNLHWYERTGSEPGQSRDTRNCTWSPLPASLELHPLNCVDWWTAQAFCIWDGGRLPTEAEWEYASRWRAVSGIPSPRSFPWGNTQASPCSRTTIGCSSGEEGVGTSRVGRFPAVGGIFDQAGNVTEWVADRWGWYEDSPCWSSMPRTNPLCQNLTGGEYVQRGEYRTAFAAARDRASGNSSNLFVGFRCARTL